MMDRAWGATCPAFSAMNFIIPFETITAEPTQTSIQQNRHNGHVSPSMVALGQSQAAPRTPLESP